MKYNFSLFPMTAILAVVFTWQPFPLYGGILQRQQTRSQKHPSVFDFSNDKPATPFRRRPTVWVT
jgi:hypothetical protein